MGNLQVRFLEGWAPAMAPGYSTLGITSGVPVNRAGMDGAPLLRPAWGQMRLFFL